MNIDNTILVLLLKKLGGTFECSLSEMTQVRMELGRYEVRQFQHPGKMVLEIELIDHQAPREVEIKVVDSITCPHCSRISYHPRDIEESYCGVCGYHRVALPTPLLALSDLTGKSE